MPIPSRLLRARETARDPRAYALTETQRLRHERIIAGATALMAEFGPANIRFRDLATGLRMATATLRFHFVDLDALLGEILIRHLRALAAALGEVPHDAPDRRQDRRSAYLAYTRRPFAGLTDAHLLLVRDRHTLPDDLREAIEETRQGLGDLLAGELACEALLLLDEPTLDAARIEARLAPAPIAAATARQRWHARTRTPPPDCTPAVPPSARAPPHAAQPVMISERVATAQFVTA